MTASYFNSSDSIMVSLLKLVDRQGKALQTIEQRLTILENSAFESHAKWMCKENAALELCAALTKKILYLEEKLNVTKLGVLTQTDPNTANVLTQTEASVDVTVDLTSCQTDCLETAGIALKEPASFAKSELNMDTIIDLRDAANPDPPPIESSKKKPQMKKTNRSASKPTSLELPDHFVDSILLKPKVVSSSFKYYDYRAPTDGSKPDLLTIFMNDYHGIDELLTKQMKRTMIRLLNSSSNKLKNCDELFCDTLKIIVEDYCISRNENLTQEVVDKVVAFLVIKALEMQPARLERVGAMFEHLVKMLMFSQSNGSTRPSQDVVDRVLGSTGGVLISVIVAYSKTACAYAMGAKTSAVLKPKHTNLLKKIRENRYALMQR
ncbi:hypothetical protein L596_029798 [Steinernema carpocapsae]|uniref:Uncharacterized protein n=1 Tax=Steinernema carpocapsae TaxID=34508 RepID=A0A4U5LQU9_STECR|nr:hypothetical protein L596_029798 [Steinernema carpocapsae]